MLSYDFQYLYVISLIPDFKEQQYKHEEIRIKKI